MYRIGCNSGLSIRGVPGARRKARHPCPNRAQQNDGASGGASGDERPIEPVWKEIQDVARDGVKKRNKAVSDTLNKARDAERAAKEAAVLAKAALEDAKKYARPLTPEEQELVDWAMESGALSKYTSYRNLPRNIKPLLEDADMLGPGKPVVWAGDPAPPSMESQLMQELGLSSPEGATEEEMYQVALNLGRLNDPDVDPLDKLRMLGNFEARYLTEEEEEALMADISKVEPGTAGDLFRAAGVPTDFLTMAADPWDVLDNYEASMAVRLAEVREWKKRRGIKGRGLGGFGGGVVVGGEGRGEEGGERRGDASIEVAGGAVEIGAADEEAEGAKRDGRSGKDGSEKDGKERGKRGAYRQIASGGAQEDDAEGEARQAYGPEEPSVSERDGDAEGEARQAYGPEEPSVSERDGNAEGEARQAYGPEEPSAPGWVDGTRDYSRARPRGYLASMEVERGGEWEPMAGEGPRSRVAEGAGTSGSGEKTGGGSNNGGDGGGAGPAGSAGDEEGRYVSFVERYGYGDWLDLGYPVDPASGPTRPPEPGWDEPDLYTRASPGNTDEFMRELSERAARMETDKLPFRGPAGELPPEDAESLLRRIQDDMDYQAHREGDKDAPKGKPLLTDEDLAEIFGDTPHIWNDTYESRAAPEIPQQQVDEFNRIRAVAYTMRNTVMGLSRDTNVPGQLKAALQVLEERGLVREDVFYDDMASSVYGLQTAKVVAGLYEELGWEMHPKRFWYARFPRYADPEDAKPENIRLWPKREEVAPDYHVVFDWVWTVPVPPAHLEAHSRPKKPESERTYPEKTWGMPGDEFDGTLDLLATAQLQLEGEGKDLSVTHVVVSWAWAKQEIELADLCLKGGMLEAEAAITAEISDAFERAVLQHGIKHKRVTGDYKDFSLFREEEDESAPE